MSAAILYVDHSVVREGRLVDLKRAIANLAEFVAANEPQIVAYAAYFNADETRMTVVHAHRNSASLEFHMRVAGPRFGAFQDLVALESIEIYGEPDEAVVSELRGKAALLGGASVQLHREHAAVVHFAPPG